MLPRGHATLLTGCPLIKLANQSRKRTPLIWVVREAASAEQSKGSALDLILIQTGERLQGYGTLVEGGSDIPATATGTISEDSISLDVKLVQLKKDYKLDLALIDNKMEGNYELYESQTLAEDGNATASRSTS